MSKSDVNDITQANGKTQTKKENAEQRHTARFSEILIKHPNDQNNENCEYGEGDDIAASKTECKYCKHEYGSSGLYPIGIL